MYILFSVLVSIVFYIAVLIVAAVSHQRNIASGRLASVSVIVLCLALLVFMLASRLAGVDLGPLLAVSYDIPNDYVQRGTLATLALLPYALACLSPVLALLMLRRR